LNSENQADPDGVADSVNETFDPSIVPDTGESFLGLHGTVGMLTGLIVSFPDPFIENEEVSK